jgi:hypothetical protein
VSPRARSVHVNEYGDIVAMAPRKTAKTARIVPPKKGTLSDPVVSIGVDGVQRVRLLRRVTEDEKVSVGGKPITQLFEVYLDGTALLRSYATERIIKDEKEIIMAGQAIAAARTKDVIDYGRFQQACLALNKLADEVGTDATEEQQQSILRSYQGLLAWREDVQAKIDSIDAALEIARAKALKVML